MRQLCMHLPPFAPDYSGACGVFFELGGMIIIHDAAGCTGNYTGFDEPRWYGSKSSVFCSGLQQIDAILGNDEKVMGRAEETAAALNPRFICITGSPAPMLIGTDFHGIAAELEERTGLPCFGFPTTGIELYDSGASEALVALIKRFVRPLPVQPRTVNLLGLTPQDFNTGENITDIRNLFEEAGWHVIASAAMNMTLEDLAQAGAAQVNVVVSQCGLETAQYLQKTCGTPWIAGQPIGRKAVQSLIEDLARTAEDGQVRTRTGEGSQGHILLMGERVTMNALRQCLKDDFGCTDCTVCGVFTPCPTLSAPGDLAAQSEIEITEVVNSGYDVIVGDPMFRRLLKPETNVRFVDFSTPSISGKLCWNDSKPFMGEKGENLLKQIFE